MKTVRKLHHLDAAARLSASGSSLITATGVPVLDELLPCGGWPKGGLVEIIVPDDFTDVISLLMPALARLSHQGRSIAMINPAYKARARLFTDNHVNPARVLQVNPHPGRSALWTAESMLRSGQYGAVLAWPTCHTELMGKRLQKAAIHGKSLGILFRADRYSVQPSGIDVRIKLDVDANGRSLSLLNNRGDVLSGAALCPL